MTEYKFDGDYYYLHYDKNDNKHGTIYRHYNNDIQYIYGRDEQNKKILSEDNTKIISDFFDDFKNDSLGSNYSQTVIKSDNQYLDKYDYNTLTDEYFKNLSLAYLCDDDNVLSLISIDMDQAIIDIGIVFGFIKTSVFNINDMKIKYKNKDIENKTDINFSTYNNYFKICNNEEECINIKLKGINISSTKRSSSKKSSKRRGGSIEIIKTEQEYITHDTIMHYFKSNPYNMKPVIIEYDYKQQNYFIVDGNHRVAFHIINNFEYIPVMIIFSKFSNLEIKEKEEEEQEKSIKHKKEMEEEIEDIKRCLKKSRRLVQ